MKTFFYTVVILLVASSTTLNAQNYKKAVYTKPAKYYKKCITTANFPNSGKIVDRRYRSVTSAWINSYYLNGKYYIKANRHITESMGLSAIFYIKPLAGAGPVNGVQFSYAMNLNNNTSWKSTYIDQVMLQEAFGSRKLIDNANHYKSQGYKKLRFYSHGGSFKSNKTLMLVVKLAMKAGDTIIIDDPQLKLDCN